MWRNATEEERRPHIEKEKSEREKYKVAIADWRKYHEAKMEEQRKQQAEQAAQWPQRFNPEDGTGVPFDASFGQAGFAAQAPFPPNFPLYIPIVSSDSHSA